MTDEEAGFVRLAESMVGRTIIEAEWQIDPDMRDWDGPMGNCS